jgi:phosphoglycolate phosphatase
MHLSNAEFRRTVELTPSLQPRPKISHVVFDFDGTLSWLRHGWPGIMLELFQEALPRESGETLEDYNAVLSEIILGLNGKPTIIQMTRFAELAKQRTRLVVDPEALRQKYQERLDEKIAARTQKIRQGTAKADDYIVHGGRSLLEHLRGTGLTLVILSSTIEERVREEAEILGLTQYFLGMIFGGTGDPTKFSKLEVLNRILEEEDIPGEQILSFGDGPAEILATKEIGGLAIAVCSDEEMNGSGLMDPYKRNLLIKAGADAAIPDFHDAISLVNFLRWR